MERVNKNNINKRTRAFRKFGVGLIKTKRVGVSNEWAFHGATMNACAEKEKAQSRKSA